jgi:hypothetical protein
MKRIALACLLILSVAAVGKAQRQRTPSDTGFYLELNSCTACGAYGNRIVQLLKHKSINAFNGYARCSGSYGSCFSEAEYAAAKTITRSKSQGSEVGVMIGPFKTLDAAHGVMQRLKSILQPLWDDAWTQGWGNSSLVHDHGNAYIIEPLNIWVIKK